MTAEIAIMNKEAIALAADSAVTMTAEKIFTSANKLFALSKYHPVGIMVYGNATFMAVHWETIIKIYRSKLGKQRFDTLEEYADNFIAFLNNGNPLFPEDLQKGYLYENTVSYFEYQIKKISKEVKSVIDREGEIIETQITDITSDVIKRHYDDWENAEMLPSIPETHIKDILNKYGDIIDRAIIEVFEELPISPASRNQLRKTGASLFSKDIFPVDIPGVVIAGFGEEEPFPSLKSFSIEGIVNNKLKYKENKDISQKIDFETTASIIPLAQQEMVATFMEGIDPDLQAYIVRDLSKIFDEYPEVIAENIEKFDDNEKRLLKEKLKEVSSKIFNDYLEGLRAYRRENYVNPVLDVVAILPKNELAAMAETLVNLTLFKRKVTMVSETVGGPIDVAVISKGDGFIWIKRKHYFKAELNPQFSANYYKEMSDEQK